MPKTDIHKILKPGASVKFANVDYSKKDKQEELAELKKRQEAVLKREEVDWQKLSNFVIKL